MLARRPLLDPTECAATMELVLAHRKLWTPRHDSLPSFTLGAAAYLDVPRHGIHTYIMRAVRNNKILRRELEWLFRRLTEAMAALLEAPVEVTPRFAVPGFHIFEYHLDLGQLQPRLHFDLQAFHLDFPTAAAADPARRLSFTVAVAMPADGAGLHTWPIKHGEVQDTSDSGLAAAAAKTTSTYHPYALGELFVHDGSHLHQIAADRRGVPGESRVTFQGHGLEVDGVWQLYW
ncbi:MAG: hypothetical protein KC933_06945 [Myxococcales bacterium]|nr:hypothetical protein [Myxococcales bacterium]